MRYTAGEGLSQWARPTARTHSALVILTALPSQVTGNSQVLISPPKAPQAKRKEGKARHHRVLVPERQGPTLAQPIRTQHHSSPRHFHRRRYSIYKNRLKCSEHVLPRFSQFSPCFSHFWCLTGCCVSQTAVRDRLRCRSPAAPCESHGTPCVCCRRDSIPFTTLHFR